MYNITVLYIKYIAKIDTAGTAGNTADNTADSSKECSLNITGHSIL